MEFLLKKINEVGERNGVVEYLFLKFSKLVALLLTVAFMRVLKGLQYKTKSILVS